MPYIHLNQSLNLPSVIERNPFGHTFSCLVTCHFPPNSQPSPITWQLPTWVTKICKATCLFLILYLRATWRNMICIHDGLTDTHGWFVSLWLTKERMSCQPSRDHRQFGPIGSQPWIAAVSLLHLNSWSTNEFLSKEKGSFSHGN